MRGAEGSPARAHHLLREVQQPRLNGVARWGAVWRVPSRAALPSSVVYVPGRAVDRVKGEWILRRPRYVDIVSAPFLEAHCIWIENGESEETVVIRFEPAGEVQGPNLRGAFVVERTTGRVRSDTLVLESPPKGAPGAGRFASTYGKFTNGGDPIPLPQRMTESLRPSDRWVRLERERIRIVETIRVFERIRPEGGSADR